MKIIQTNVGAIKKKIMNIVKVIGNGKNVLVGLPKDSNNYPDGTSVVDVAVTNEFGGISIVSTEYARRAKEKEIDLSVGDKIRIPERSFMRTTIADNVSKYKSLIRKTLISAIKTEGKDLEQNMGKIGEVAKADIQSKIKDISEPANSDRTIEIKESDNPLVDTGHLTQSITWVLEDA